MKNINQLLTPFEVSLLRGEHSIKQILLASLSVGVDYIKESVNEVLINPVTHNQKLERVTWGISALSIVGIILLNLFQ